MKNRIYISLRQLMLPLQCMLVTSLLLPQSLHAETLHNNTDELEIAESVSKIKVHESHFQPNQRWVQTPSSQHVGLADSAHPEVNWQVTLSSLVPDLSPTFEELQIITAQVYIQTLSMAQRKPQHRQLLKSCINNCRGINISTISE